MEKLIICLLLASYINPLFSQSMKWGTERSVRKELKRAADQGQTFYSQFDWYAPRERGNLESQFTKDMGRRPLIYGVDFYYATGTWFSEDYKSKCRNNLINIVRQAWRENKAIPSFSWHLENPYVNSDFKDDMGCRFTYYPDENNNYPEEHRYVIREILNETGEPCGFGGYLRENNKTGYDNPRMWFEAQCREVADIINQLKDDKGRYIPIILRLWHECEDSWTWWGPNTCTDDEYKEFFILTEKLIRKYAPRAKILWGYCTDQYWVNDDNYLKRYPGDKYIDIMGYDDYSIRKNYRDGENKSLERARFMTKIAKEHKKVAAIFETSNSDDKTSETFFRDKVSVILKDEQTSIALFQMWSSGRYITDNEKNDRAWMLAQPYIIIQDIKNQSNE